MLGFFVQKIRNQRRGIVMDVAIMRIGIEEVRYGLIWHPTMIPAQERVLSALHVKKTRGLLHPIRRI